MEAATALHSLLVSAGLTERVASLVEVALDAVPLPGGSPDDVAGALLRWRHLSVVDAYETGLREGSEGADATMIRSLGPQADPGDDEPPWDTLEQTTLFGGPIPRSKEGD